MVAPFQEYHRNCEKKLRVYITMFAPFQEYHRNCEKKIKSLYGLGGRCQQNYRRLYGFLTMFQELSLDPCSTLEHQAWSNNQSQHDLLVGGVSYR